MTDEPTTGKIQHASNVKKKSLVIKHSYSITNPAAGIDGTVETFLSFEFQCHVLTHCLFRLRLENNMLRPEIILTSHLKPPVVSHLQMAKCHLWFWRPFTLNWSFPPRPDMEVSDDDTYSYDWNIYIHIHVLKKSNNSGHEDHYKSTLPSVELHCWYVWNTLNQVL